MDTQKLENAKKQLSEIEAMLTDDNLAKLSKEQIEELITKIATLKVEIEVAENLIKD